MPATIDDPAILDEIAEPAAGGVWQMRTARDDIMSMDFLER